jgi:hypothetical protein
MSDELRDMLRGRADAIDVPSGDVTSVVSAGRGIKARRFLMAGAASVAVITLVAWALTGGGVLDRGSGEVAEPGPTSTDDQRHVVAVCSEVPFRPGYLPDGWDYTLDEGSGGQRGIPFEEQSPKALGHYTYRGSADGGGSSTLGFIDVYEQDAYYQLGSGATPIEVLDRLGHIGAVEDGYSVEFTYKGCDYSVMAFGPPLQELAQVARRLQPRDTCEGRDTRAPDPLPDGRHFGYITAIEGIAIDFDEAEFLTGEEANARAREDGAIGPDETVPNDYYIDDNNASVRGMSISRTVEVLLETVHRDGMPGLARWEYPELVCMFESDVIWDRANVESPFWITVQEGLVTKIEQQFLP